MTLACVSNRHYYYYYCSPIQQKTWDRLQRMANTLLQMEVSLLGGLNRSMMDMALV